MTARDERDRRAGSGEDRDHLIQALGGAAQDLERRCVVASGRRGGVVRVGLLQAIATVRLRSDDVAHQDLRETGYWLADAAELLANAQAQDEVDAALARVRERTSQMGRLAEGLLGSDESASSD